MDIKRLSQTPHGSTVNICVHGPAGAGKTRLIRTLTHPATDSPPLITDPGRILIVSAEAGLLSLGSDFDASVTEVMPGQDIMQLMRDVYKAVRAGTFDAVAIDSLSEVAQMSLSACLKDNKDGRAAYGEFQEETRALFRAIRMLPCLVYVTAQSMMANGKAGPLMPQDKLSAKVPYEFDELFLLRPTDTGRELTCHETPTTEAKDRSGKLAPAEPPCLSHIVRKIKGAA